MESCHETGTSFTSDRKPAGADQPGHVRHDFLENRVGATAPMWLAIVLSIYMGGKSSGSGFVLNTVTRFMGLIVIAMGIQFAMPGIHSFFSSLAVS